MEVFNENDPGKGPDLRCGPLPLETVPWAFVIDRDGQISARFEGAFGAEELVGALRRTFG